MKKREMIKGVLGFGAAVGAGMIVGNLVRVTTPETTGKIGVLFIRMGAYALGGVAMDHAETYMGKQVDVIADAYDGLRGVIKEVKEEAQAHNITNVTPINPDKE